MREMAVCTRVVRGSFHQGDEGFFDSRSRGRQCVANCVQAAVYTKICPVGQWTRDVLDSILLGGDALYLRSTRSGPRGLLNVHQVENPVTFMGRRFYVECTQEELIYGAVSESATVGCSLLNAIGSLVDGDGWTLGVLTLSCGQGGYGTLVVVSKDKCYFFDSHSRNVQGLQVVDGTSVLLEFENVEQLELYLERLACNLHCDQFTLDVLHVREEGVQNVGVVSDQVGGVQELVVDGEEDEQREEDEEDKQEEEHEEEHCRKMDQSQKEEESHGIEKKGMGKISRRRRRKKIFKEKKRKNREMEERFSDDHDGVDGEVEEFGSFDESVMDYLKEMGPSEVNGAVSGTLCGRRMGQGVEGSFS